MGLSVEHRREKTDKLIGEVNRATVGFRVPSLFSPQNSKTKFSSKQLLWAPALSGHGAPVVLSPSPLHMLRIAHSLCSFQELYCRSVKHNCY